jgi:hypothetical protein
MVGTLGEGVTDGTGTDLVGVGVGVTVGAGVGEMAGSGELVILGVTVGVGVFVGVAVGDVVGSGADGETVGVGVTNTGGSTLPRF